MERNLRILWSSGSIDKDIGMPFVTANRQISLNISIMKPTLMKPTLMCKDNLVIRSLNTCSQG